MGRKIQIALLLVLLSFSVNAQSIFSETFSWYGPKTSSSDNLWILDSLLWEHLTTDSTVDQIGSENAAYTGNFTNESGSITSSGGKNKDFGGTNDYVLVANARNPGTNDFTIQAWVKTPASGGNQYIVNKRDVGIGWMLDRSTNDVRAIFLDGSTYTVTETVSANTFYYIWVTFDRSGNMSMVINNGTPGTDDISADVATDLNPSSTFTIGAYSFNPTSNEWYGGIMAIKYDSTTVLTTKQLMEDCWLAENWTSSNGLVARTDTFGFAQAFKGTADPMVFGFDNPESQDTLTLSGDSTRYTYQFSDVTAFSSTVLLFQTIDETISYTLPDSAFDSGYAAQLVFDGWTETIFGATYTVIDNITITTYEAPVTLTTTTSPDKFLGFPEDWAGYQKK
jgi:hypothetical protein